MSNSLLILGAGELGQVVAEMVTGQYDRIAFLDDNPTKEKQELYPVIGGLQDLETICKDFTHAIPAYGNTALKDEMRKRIRLNDVKRQNSLTGFLKEGNKWTKRCARKRKKSYMLRFRQCSLTKRYGGR